MSARVERTNSEDETIALGEEIGRSLGRRAVVLLIGELGAGKTTIAKGIIKGLGAAAPDDVASPTFTLIHEFGDDPKVYHIEWGERFPALWPPDHIELHLSWVDETVREVRVQGLGAGARGRRVPRWPRGGWRGWRRGGASGWR